MLSSVLVTWIMVHNLFWRPFSRIVIPVVLRVIHVIILSVDFKLHKSRNTIIFFLFSLFYHWKPNPETILGTSLLLSKQWLTGWNPRAHSHIGKGRFPHGILEISEVKSNSESFWSVIMLHADVWLGRTLLHSPWCRSQETSWRPWSLKWV